MRAFSFAEKTTGRPNGSARRKSFGAMSTTNTNANCHATNGGGGGACGVSSPHPRAWPSRH
jgi:hypothetical protein